MPYIYYNSDIEISVDDFLDGCTDSDIEDIVAHLIDSGWIKKTEVLDPNQIGDAQSPWDIDWYNAVTKIRDRGQLQLSKEEEELILSIANRIV